MKHLVLPFLRQCCRPVVLACLLLGFFLWHPVQAQVSGRVFHDFDANGTQNASTFSEPGVPLVVVKAYVDRQTPPLETQTDAEGKFSFSASVIPAGTDVRIEFIEPGGNLVSGPAGTQNGTTVQFLTAPASNVNLGLNNPANYCQISDLRIVSTCFINGDAARSAESGQAAAVVAFPYEATGVTGPDNFPAAYLATGAKVGSVWGLAYQRKSGLLLAAAVVKRHAGLGPLGTGGIYLINVATGAVSGFVDLQTLGINTGSNPHSGLSDKLSPSIDSVTFHAAGRTGIGGIRLSEDERFLYLINMNERKLHRLFVDAPARTPSASDISSWTIPDPGCPNGDYRVWAVKTYRQKVYIGGVCSLESTPDPANWQKLSAFVYEVAENELETSLTPTFRKVLEFPLSFRRGVTDITGNCVQYDHWLPWTQTFPQPCSANFVMHPQPIVSDIEFDIDGSMIIGMLDRFGLQSGVGNHDLHGNGQYDGFTAGDLLRASFQNGAFVLESNGKAGDLTGCGTGTNEGPGGGEFYCDEKWFFMGNYAHRETATGGLLLVPGQAGVLATVFDPIEEVYMSGGWRFFDNHTGNLRAANGKPHAFAIYTSKDLGTFGKAAGVGDIEAVCAAAPIEIGNRIWLDENRNGIQDPAEKGLAAVRITLHDVENSRKQIAEAQTAPDGTYYFNQSNVAGGLKWFHEYELRVDLGQSALKKKAEVYRVTINATREHQQAANSDATLAGNTAVVAVRTGDAGHNNHSFDIGLQVEPPVCYCPDIMLLRIP